MHAVRGSEHPRSSEIAPLHKPTFTWRSNCDRFTLPRCLRRESTSGIDSVLVPVFGTLTARFLPGGCFPARRLANEAIVTSSVQRLRAPGPAMTGHGSMHASCETPVGEALDQSEKETRPTEPSEAWQRAKPVLMHGQTGKQEVEARAEGESQRQKHSETHAGRKQGDSRSRRMRQGCWSGMRLRYRRRRDIRHGCFSNPAIGQFAR